MRWSRRQYKHAVRRLKRAGDKIRDDKFVTDLLDGGANIFQEIRKYRGKSTGCSSRVDDQVGASNIANQFANIY